MTAQPSDGKPAQIVVLKNRFGMSISLMDIGNLLTCIVPEWISSMLLGSADMNAHKQQTAYLECNGWAFC